MNKITYFYMAGCPYCINAAIERSKIDEYAEEAKGLWQNTPQWKEYEEKTKGRSKEELSQLGNEMMRGIFGEFGKIKDKDPGCEEAQELVKKLQDFLTEHFYTCTNEILKGLGMMYACNEDFTKNIDAAGGEGTADFAAKAIEIYCR